MQRSWPFARVEHDPNRDPAVISFAKRMNDHEYDREAYKQRNLNKRYVNALKQFRGIATRYDKTARAFLSMLCIGAAKLRIKAVNTA